MSENLCPRCAAPNRDSARFCQECGEALLSGVSQASSGSMSPGEVPSLPTLVGKALQGRYQIQSELGRGGFGAVYRATDINLQKPCAVKENLDTSPEAQRQFEREALILANLAHPNLPRVTDHFTIPEQGQYLVMDFVEGEDLASLAERRGAIPVEQASPWISQVADALEYLHNQDPPVIHRDVKPSNVRINPAGQAMLVDFGLVKKYDPHLKTTMGARAITPGYAPPEQYGRGSTDPRTDLYALGATFYTLVTGLEPLESVLRAGGEHMYAAHEVNPHVTPQVGQVIERAMALDPEQRYQNAAQFKAALQASFESPDIPASSTETAPTGRAASTFALESEPQARPELIAPVPARPEVVPAPEAVPPVEERKPTSRLIIRIGLAVVGILCLVSAVTLALWTFGSPPGSKATSTAQFQATVAAQAEATLTNQTKSTSTARAQATADFAAIQTSTAQVQATATAGVMATLTSQAQATSEAISQATGTVQAQVQATEQARQQYISTLTVNKGVLYGPRDGILAHDSDEAIEASPSSPGVRNFIAEAKVFNPYATSKGTWTSGLIFRSEGGSKQYRLIIKSDKNWLLTLNLGSGSGRIIHEGEVPDLNVEENGSNLIRVIAHEDQGWLYVNDVFIAELDLSSRYSGSAYVVTGFYEGSEIPGALTKYEDFTVWQLF